MPEFSKMTFDELTREGGYELIAGERRLRASKRAGFTHINAIVYTAGEQERAKTALGENLENVFVVHGAPPSSVQCLLKFIVRYCF